MRIGYMTNAWGITSGTGGGVTSIKDLLYLSAGLNTNVFQEIKKAGFDYIEIFEGNLIGYGKSFSEILEEQGLKLLAVYTGGNFIFKDIQEEEFYRIEKTCEAAVRGGARYLTVGGGAVRHDGIREDDYRRLGEALDRIHEIAEKYGLCACYHPHLGTIAENAQQIDRVLHSCKIAFCPDCGHIQAAGSNAADVVEKYAERISYMHLKDFDGRSFTPLGMGTVDFKRIFSLLYEHQNIDFTVEAERIADPFLRAEDAKRFLEQNGIR